MKTLIGKHIDIETFGPTRPPEQPRMVNISKSDIERGCIDIRFWIKDIENERDLEKLQRESNWTAYQEALRLLNQAEAQRDELLAALKKSQSMVFQFEHRVFHGKTELADEITSLIAKCEAAK